MARRKTLEELCHDEYNDPEVEAAVLAHAVESGNKAKIEAGELVLPCEQDAEIWHRRATGRLGTSADHQKALDRIAELEKTVAAWSKEGRPNDPDRMRSLEERIRMLEGGK